MVIMADTSTTGKTVFSSFWPITVVTGRNKQSQRLRLSPRSKDKNNNKCCKCSLNVLFLSLMGLLGLIALVIRWILFYHLTPTPFAGDSLVLSSSSSSSFSSSSSVSAIDGTHCSPHLDASTVVKDHTTRLTERPCQPITVAYAVSLIKVRHGFPPPPRRLFCTLPPNFGLSRLRTTTTTLFL